MYKIATVIAAGISLATMGTASIAAEDAAPGTDVDYDSAMQCSALYTYLGGVVAGEPEEPVLLDIATRWLVLAMNRDGTEEGDRANDDLEPTVDRLMAELDDMGEDEDAIEAFLNNGVSFCDEAQELVAEEFESIDTDA